MCTQNQNLVTVTLLTLVWIEHTKRAETPVQTQTWSQEPQHGWPCSSHRGPQEAMVMISPQELLAGSGPPREEPHPMDTEKDNETQEKRHPNGKAGVCSTQSFPDVTIV